MPRRKWFQRSPLRRLADWLVLNWEIGGGAAKR